MLTSEKHQIKIASNFFAGAFRDYQNWHWAWVREIFQNSSDARRCTEIKANITQIGSNTLVEVENNGSPMDKEILCEKLLAIGGSGKQFAGTVGGFGKAKEILMLAHPVWTVETGNLKATGLDGGAYELAEIPYFHGTRTTVSMAGAQADRLIDEFRTFASMTQWSGKLTVNDEVLTTNLRKGAHRKDLTWGTIYTNNSFQRRLIVRINGIPMFYRDVNFKNTIIIELGGASNQTLTSNRDGLQSEMRKELDEFIDDVSGNAKKAFKDCKRTERFHFDGLKLVGSYEQVTGGRLGTNIDCTTTAATRVLTAALRTATKIHESDSGSEAEDLELVEKPSNKIRPEFYIKSEISGKIPARFMPDTFSANSVKLINNWIAILLELASLTKCQKSFAVGFIFNDDSEAEHERENGNHIVYINPAKLVDEMGKQKRLINRWTASDNWKLVSVAVHEFTHLEGYNYHDEDFAGRLTDLMGLVLENKGKFNRHFKNQTNAF